jgi:hypothetical protein
MTRYRPPPKPKKATPLDWPSQGRGKELAAKNRRSSPPVQAENVLFFPRVDRRCVVCGVHVGNLNLGGSELASAFTGRLWCLSCAS